MRIGLVTDTHLPRHVRTLGELGPSVVEFLSSVDLLLHGGDVVSGSVLDWLAQFAPVVAATGNNDGFTHPCMEPLQFLEFDGWRLGMAHDLEPENRPLAVIEAGVFHRTLDIIIGGHTHFEHLRRDGRLVLINSGSPILPHQYETRLGTAGLLEIQGDLLHAEIVHLGDTPGKPNPGKASVLDVHRDELRAD